jgi:hypothetical protein
MFPGRNGSAEYGGLNQTATIFTYVAPFTGCESDTKPGWRIIDTD